MKHGGPGSASWFEITGRRRRLVGRRGQCRPDFADAARDAVGHIRGVEPAPAFQPKGEVRQFRAQGVELVETKLAGILHGGGR